MAAIEPSLFDWEALDAHSDLERFILVRDHLPDDAIIQALEAQRGHGRNIPRQLPCPVGDN